MSAHQTSSSSQSAETLLQEVELVPTLSGDILEDKGRVTLSNNQPDVISHAAAAAVGKVVESELAWSSGEIEHVLLEREQQLTSVLLHFPLDKNNFASELTDALAVLQGNLENYGRALAAVADNSRYSLLPPLERERLLGVVKANTKKQNQLRTRIGELFLSFHAGNNWPRLLAAWQILVQEQYRDILEHTSWLEILARQAWQLLGNSWQQQAKHFFSHQDNRLPDFFRRYFASSEFAQSSLPGVNTKQLQTFLTPVVLSFASPGHLSNKHLAALSVQPWVNKILAATALSQQEVSKISQRETKKLLSTVSQRQSVQLEKLQQEFTAVQDKLNQLLVAKKQLAAAKKQLAAAQEQLKVSQQQIVDLKKQLNDHQALSAAYADLKKHSSKWQTKRQELQERLDYLSSNNRDLEKYLSQLDRENESLRQQIVAPPPRSALERKVEILMSDKKSLAKKLTALSAQNEQLQLALATAKQDNWRLHHENIFANSRLQEATSNQNQEEETANLATAFSDDNASETIMPIPTSYFYAGDNSPLLPPQSPEFATVTHQIATPVPQDSPVPLPSALVKLGLKRLRLSERFPLCSRRHRELTFTLLTWELERVLAGSLYALAKKQRQI